MMICRNAEGVHGHRKLSKERNPLSAQNHTLS